MSTGSAPQPQLASPVELLGRIRELHTEIAEGSVRRARLAGENAVLINLLRQANDEIVALRAAAAERPQPPAGEATVQAQAPTSH